MIVLIDNNRDEQEIALAALAKVDAALRVEAFTSGEAALEFLAARPAGEPAAVVLLDLKMPLVDGFEVLRRLRSAPRTAWQPVVMFTSSREDRDVEACYRLGANSYVCKPVDFARMVEVLRAVVSYWVGINEPARSA